MSIMNIYGCGGAGINLASKFLKHNNKKEEGSCEIKTYFIDTSLSNIEQGFPEDQIYLVEGLDGSGKVRSENYEAVTEVFRDMLLKFKPTDINIVIHSCSGGE